MSENNEAIGVLRPTGGKLVCECGSEKVRALKSSETDRDYRARCQDCKTLWMVFKTCVLCGFDKDYAKINGDTVRLVVLKVTHAPGAKMLVCTKCMKERMNLDYTIGWKREKDGKRGPGSYWGHRLELIKDCSNCRDGFECAKQDGYCQTAGSYGCSGKKWS